MCETACFSNLFQEIAVYETPSQRLYRALVNVSAFSMTPKISTFVKMADDLDFWENLNTPCILTQNLKKLIIDLCEHAVIEINAAVFERYTRKINCILLSLQKEPLWKTT
tara:strand:+ start:101411 stop:101740 length:330 start_codon:yes stop_codon:yes gene_type:complete